MKAPTKCPKCGGELQEGFIAANRLHGGKDESRLQRSGWDILSLDPGRCRADMSQAFGLMDLGVVRCSDPNRGLQRNRQLFPSEPNESWPPRRLHFALVAASP